MGNDMGIRIGHITDFTVLQMHDDPQRYDTLMVASVDDVCDVVRTMCGTGAGLLAAI